MLLKKLSLVTLACLFANGCLISGADDDDTGTESSTPTSSPTTDDSSEETTVDPDSSGTTSSEDTTAGETGDPGPVGCGWGPIPGNDEIPNGYQCGFEEEDPEGVHPIACPATAMLESGLDCKTAGVTGEGCCDANGDVWYCIDPDPDNPDDTEVVQTEDCADPEGTGTDTDTPDTDTEGSDTDTDTEGSDTDTDTDTDTEGSDTEGTTTTGK